MLAVARSPVLRNDTENLCAIIADALHACLVAISLKRGSGLRIVLRTLGSRCGLQFHMARIADTDDKPHQCAPAHDNTGDEQQLEADAREITANQWSECASNARSRILYPHIGGALRGR